MNRRNAIKNIGISLGALAITPSIIGIMNGCTTTAGDSFTPKFFSKSHLITVGEILEAILPHTEDGIPGATQLKLVEFIDRFLYGVVADDELAKIKLSIKALKTYAQVEHSLENAKSKSSSINWKNHLDKYLVPSPKAEKRWREALDFSTDHFIALSKRTPTDALNYYALQTIRNLAVFAFRTNRIIGEDFLYYAPIPGQQEGCVSLEDATGGKMHAPLED